MNKELNNLLSSKDIVKSLENIVHKHDSKTETKTTSVGGAKKQLKKKKSKSKSKTNKYAKDNKIRATITMANKRGTEMKSDTMKKYNIKKGKDGKYFYDKKK